MNLKYLAGRSTVNLICSLLSVLASACHSSQYPVVDSGLAVVPSQTQFFWIDNRHVIFGGFEAKSSDGLARQSHLGIYIWDTDANTFVRHADWGSDAGVLVLCFNHGYVFYSVNLVAKYGHPEFDDVRAGQLGSEVRLPPTPGLYQEELSRCKGYPRIRPPSSSGELIYELRPEDGYIFVAKNDHGMPVDASNMNDPVRLYKSGRIEPITLPILAKEMNLDVLTYSEYANRYVLAPLAWHTKNPSEHYTWPPPPGTMMRIYLISPDGRVDTIEIPPGTYPAAGVAPTRAGMFWTSFDVRSNGVSSGTWLWNNGRVTKLFDTAVASAAASPNGCKVVYFNADKGSDAPTAQIMNFCK